MHGRLKVRTTDEQLEAKKREQLEKLKVFREAVDKIFKKRENKEYDEDGLDLTARLLEQNPDFYTLWNYRREILLSIRTEKNQEELKNLALTELNLTQRCLQTNPKSYGAWHHRSWAMEFNPEPDWKKELKLSGYFLSQDERNFHCWDYRRLICKKCEVTNAEELAYTTELIKSNFSNYSAWHYRSTLLPAVHPGPTKGSVEEKVLLNEFELVQNAAFTDPNDQSVWFYHRWLLGRNKMPFQILNVTVLNYKTVAVLVSESITKMDCKHMNLEINSENKVVTWKSVPSYSPCSSIWICDISKTPSSEIQNSTITVEFVKGNEQSSLAVKVESNKAFNWSKENRTDAFRSELSATTKEVLKQELESCEQLNDLEPNCKWTIFTSVLLMRALNNRNYEKKIIEYMNQLKTVDASRKIYYDDLRSKFIIENAIEMLPVEALQINLSKLNLTSLHHCDHFIMIEKIDLSSNCLTSIVPLRYLICVKSMNLDENQLTNLDGIEELKNLEHLSVKRNCLQNVSILEVIELCKNLQEVHLSHNPVVNNVDFFSLSKKLIEKIIYTVPS